MTKLNIQYEGKRFLNYEPPNGFIVRHPACHALFYYYVLARKNFEEQAGWEVVLEGDKDPIYKYKELLESVAQVYGVKPEEMIKYWLNIDMQCKELNLPKLPDLEMFRFNKPIEVRSLN